MAAAAAPPMDLGSVINDGLEEIATEHGITDEGGEGSPDIEGVDEPSVTDATAAVGEEVPDVAAAPEVTEAPVAAPQPSDGPYPLSQDGNGYVVPKQDFQILDGIKQYAEAVQNRFPTANDAEIAYNESADYRSILADYSRGEQNGINSILAHFAGVNETDPTMAQQYARSFVNMANQMPEALKQVNPQAYQSFRENIAAQEINEAYDKAMKSGDPADFVQAQRLDWARTGQYKTELPKFDAEAAARDEFAKREAAFAQRETQIMQRDWQNFDKGSINGPKWNDYWNEIDRALEPIKGNYNPKVYQGIKNTINTDLLDALKTDPQWVANHNNALASLQSAFEAAWKAGQPTEALNQRIQFFKNDFMTRVRKNLPSIAKAAIGDQPKAPAPKVATTPAPAQPKPAPAAAPRPAAARPATATPRAPNGQFQPARNNAFQDSWKQAFK